MLQPIYYTKRDTLKNVAPWVKHADDGMKQAVVIPTHQGLQVTLFDENAGTVDCFVPYELIVEQVVFGMPQEQPEAPVVEEAAAEPEDELTEGSEADEATEGSSE